MKFANTKKKRCFQKKAVVAAASAKKQRWFLPEHYVASCSKTSINQEQYWVLWQGGIRKQGANFLYPTNVPDHGDRDITLMRQIEQYHSRRKNTYVETSGRVDDKMHCNKSFTMAVAAAKLKFKKDFVEVGLLEDASLISSKFLVSGAAVPSEVINIPNFSGTRKESHSVFRWMKKSRLTAPKLRGLQIYPHTKFVKFLTSRRQRREEEARAPPLFLGAVFGDFMCLWQTAKPDIVELFSGSHLSPEKSIVAFTFSSRAEKGGASKAIGRAHRFIQKQARENNYQCELLEKYIYQHGKSMYFLQYRITHITHY